MERNERQGMAAPAGTDHNDRPGGVVVVLNRDLMFGMRIRQALQSLGYESRFAGETGGFVDLLRDVGPAAVLGVIDMNGAVDWALIRAGKDDGTIPTPLLGFGPHVDIEGRRAAKGAGVDRLVSNGDFHRDTTGLLRRYARPTREDGSSGSAASKIPPGVRPSGPDKR
jgi:hypothetical protein